MDNREKFLQWLIQEEKLSYLKCNILILAFDFIDDFLKSKGVATGIFYVKNGKEFIKVARSKFLLDSDMKSNEHSQKYFAFKNHKNLFRDFLDDKTFEIQDDLIEESNQILANAENESNLINALSEIEPEKLSTEEANDVSSHTNKYIYNAFVNQYDIIIGEKVLPDNMTKRKKDAPKNDAIIAFDLLCNNYCIFDNKGTMETKKFNPCFCSDNSYFECQPNGIYPENELSSVFSVFCDIETKHKSLIKDVISYSLYNVSVCKTGLFCLLPDNLDDFNKSIKSQLVSSKGNIFPIPRSIAALLDLQDNLKLGIKSSEKFAVIDLDGFESSITVVTTKKIQEYEKPIFVRKAQFAFDKSEQLAYFNISKTYLDKYCQKYGLSLTEKVENEFIYLRKFEKLLETKNTQFAFNNDDVVKIEYDSALVLEVFNMRTKLLNELKKELSGYTIVIVDSLNKENSCVNKNQLYAGAKIIHNRLENNEPLWEEYLPHLELEVINGGRFDWIELIPKDQERDVRKTLFSEEIIKVNGTITLQKGKKEFELPLKRDRISSYSKDKAAHFTHPAFPLQQSLEMTLEVHYKYGNEDSYKLVAKNKDFGELHSEWIDAAEINVNNIYPDYKDEQIEITESDVNWVQSNIIEIQRRLYGIEKETWKLEIDEKHSNEVRLVSNVFNQFHWPNYKKITSREAIENKIIGNEIKNILGNLVTTGAFNSLCQYYLGNDDTYADAICFYDKKIIDAFDNSVIEFLSNSGVILSAKKDIEKDIEPLIKKFIVNNDLQSLINVSRTMKKGQFDIFDNVIRLLKKHCNEFTLRNISAVCWQNSEWIKILREKDSDIILLIIKSIYKFLTNISEKTISKVGYNPRKLRDILEVLLAICRLKEDDCSILDANSKETKDIVYKLKLIDKWVSSHQGTLKFRFVSRIKAHLDKDELYDMSDTCYMLIQSLTNKESISLLSFSE